MFWFSLMDILFQPLDFLLESVMSKCFISFCHLMHVFFFFYGCSGIVHCIHKLILPVFLPLSSRLLLREYNVSQRRASASRRLSGLYFDRYLVRAPPIRLAFTSSTGMILVIASSNTSSAGFPAFSSILVNAPYTIF